MITFVFGTATIIAIILLGRTHLYYLTGLLPLFPTFSLIAHVNAAVEKSACEFKLVVLYGLFSLIPYAVYLGSVYLLVDILGPWKAMGVALAFWFIIAAVIFNFWSAHCT